MADSSGIYNVHSNHLETPILLTNNTNQIVWRANHESFGKAVINDDVDGNGNRITFNIRFPGQYYDAETGLHYNRHRYYDAATGRYITSDPIGLLGGLNTYIYAKANPMNYIDQLGLDIEGAIEHARDISNNPARSDADFHAWFESEGNVGNIDNIKSNESDLREQGLHMSAEALKGIYFNLIEKVTKGTVTLTKAMEEYLEKIEKMIDIAEMEIEACKKR